MKAFVILSELFLTFLTGLIWAAAFLHLLVGVIELAAMLAACGAVMFCATLFLEWRRQGL